MMAALRSLKPDAVPVIDWDRVTIGERVDGWLSSLGRPPFPVIGATVIGWTTIGYVLVAPLFGWPQ